MPISPPPLDHDTDAVVDAFALAWTWRPRTAVLDLVTGLGLKASSGRRFTGEIVKTAIATLQHQRWMVEMPGRPGFYRLADDRRSAAYRRLLDRYPLPLLRDALYRQTGFRADTIRYSWPLWEMAATVSVVRLELFGDDPARLQNWQQILARQADWNGIYREACLAGEFDAVLFERILPDWRWAIAFVACEALCFDWNAQQLPLYRYVLAQPPARRHEMPGHLHLQVAEALLFSGEHTALDDWLRGDDRPSANALRAGRTILAGDWDDGASAYAACLKARQAEIGGRKQLFPDSIGWLYPYALFAQGGSKALAQANRFCVGESGSRTPAPTGWGLWAHAAAARLGDAPLLPDAFTPAPFPPDQTSLPDLWTLLLHAWMAAEAPLPARGKARERHDSTVAALRQRLQACGFAALEALVEAADRHLRGEAVTTPFFARGGGEAWRTVLDALSALGDGASPADSGSAAQRLLWEIALDAQGAIESIAPFEQKRGPRGWSKPKAVPLTRLAGNAALAPQDARVAASIRVDRNNARRCRIDRSAAIAALIGHPGVVLAGQPEHLVDVVQGMPQLETLRETTRTGERIVLRITPQPHPAVDPRHDVHFFLDDAARREIEALRYIHVRQDSPQRLCVVRLTPAQRRAAQLVSGAFSVPATAQGELQAALRALTGHFDVHSDDAAPARQIESESRLRAELAPAGDGLLLRLAVAPLGPQGPRLPPGQGRSRVMAAVAGEQVGCVRDLAAEQAHRDAVLDRLDFLDPASGNHEWTVDDPELALAMVEALPTLSAIAAVDWPRGKPVRVATAELKHLQIRVASQRDWLRIDGRATLDEGQVFELQALLAAAQARSRFVALGDGAYLALSKSLRERLQALAAVSDLQKDGVTAPLLAAPWLEEGLDGAVVEVDREFRARIDRLRQAQAQTPGLPATLQAELRAYQEDGFAWAMRLAQAGFGACLADDMGLGKTLQALAILLARAAGGPALVVAPTSVCGNWLAEAARFAPTLTVSIYGEGERAGRIDALGPGDVLIVSYTLMQQAGDAFAARHWHTLVADEAQAVKNASAKRSQALFDLPADFRLALSGTPVENRLSELWSIMRFCNPGLLGTQSRFDERFASPIERGRDRDTQRLLRRLIAPFVLRRTKAQVLDDLPARTELILTVTPEGDEAAYYEALRRNLVGEAETLAAGPTGPARLHILAQLMKLRRAACDPRLVTPELATIGAKVRAFAELAAELAANGHKALVFSQFVDFLTLLRAPLDAAGIAYQYLDGSTPPAERTRRVSAFQGGEGDLFLISLKAGGFGLNLTAADYVVITDPWWNPAAEDQAMGRAHRIGQQRPVTVYRLVSKGTLEERIIELHHDKRALADGVLAAGEDGAMLPSTEDLIALMRG